MKTNNSYFSRILVILIAVMMVFTMMPSMAFAADSADTTESNEQAQTCPVTIKAGENAMSATATGEKLSSDYNGVADVFEVAVAPEIDKITVGDYQNGKILVYNYDAEKNWLAGYYENGGTEGVTQTEVSVDYNKDNVADYIYIDGKSVTQLMEEGLCSGIRFWTNCVIILLDGVLQPNQEAFDAAKERSGGGSHYRRYGTCFHKRGNHQGGVPILYRGRG